MTNINEFIKFGNKLANNSRKISLNFFKKNINIHSKSESKFDPVTEADISTQNYINNCILDYSCHRCFLLWNTFLKKMFGLFKKKIKAKDIIISNIGFHRVFNYCRDTFDHRLHDDYSLTTHKKLSKTY